jgi:hypothetical protein
VLAALSLSGCIGDPDAVGAPASVRDAEPTGWTPTIARELWEGAPAGCEDAPTDAYLVRTEGEPLLGALLDPDGRVLCVDSFSLIEAELQLTRFPTTDYSADPSPQPSHPGDAEAGFRAAHAGSAEAFGGVPMRADEP